MKPSSLLLIAAGLLALSGTSIADARSNAPGAHAPQANAPENVPVANQGVCDEVRGATPGLYGLCVAFCEAQQCTPDLSQSDPFKDCRPSAPWLLDSYERIQRPGDPDMPCIQQEEPCPCWTSQELAELRHPAPGDDTLCLNSSSDVLWSIRGENQAGAYTTQVFGSQTNGTCFVMDACADGNCLGVIRNLLVSQEEALACKTQAEMAAQFRSLCL